MSTQSTHVFFGVNEAISCAGVAQFTSVQLEKGLKRHSGQDSLYDELIRYQFACYGCLSRADSIKIISLL